MKKHFGELIFVLAVLVIVLIALKIKHQSCLDDCEKINSSGYMGFKCVCTQK